MTNGYSPAVTASRTRLCAVALFAALAAGACSSGGGDGRATGAKGTYVAQVDPICADLRAKLGGELGKDPAKQATEVEAAVQKIMAVKKPAEDSERADLFIAAMQNLYIALQDIDQSRIVNDATRVTKAQGYVTTATKTAASAAKSYGMVECARSF